jgi:hypothetical protein
MNNKKIKIKKRKRTFVCIKLESGGTENALYISCNKFIISPQVGRGR